MENLRTHSFENHTISESEQMYLLMIMQLGNKETEEPVSVTSIAQALEIKPVSANQMIHNLQNAGYVEYLPYKGVHLTSKGKEHAQNVLRYRRLWQTFLTEKLGLNHIDAENIACSFEHATTIEAANQLEEWLYPARNITEENKHQISLDQLAPGQQARITSLPENTHVKEFLLSQGISQGARLSVIGRGVNNDLLLKGPDGYVHLTAQITSEIFVDFAEMAHG